MKYLQLGKRQEKPNKPKYFALVDDEDYEYLNQWKWHRTGKPYEYAIRVERNGNKYTQYLMHRVIMKAKKGEVIDHSNGNIYDNQKSNLRICTKAENARNRKGNANTSSQYKGVTMEIHGKYKYWRTQLAHNKKIIRLGRFPFTNDGEILAAKAYDKCALLHHKEFARLTFPIINATK